MAESPNALRAIKRFEGLRTGRIKAAVVNLFLPGLGHILRGRPLVGAAFAVTGIAVANTHYRWAVGAVALVAALFDSGGPSLSADDRRLVPHVRHFQVWYAVFTGLMALAVGWGVVITLAELGFVDAPRVLPRPEWMRSIIADLAVVTGTLIVAARLGAMLWSIVRLKRELKWKPISAAAPS